MEKFFDYLYKSFPLIVILLAVIYILNQYKTNELRQRLFAMQIKKLEKDLNVKVSNKAVNEALSDDFINKGISQLQVV